MRGEEREQTERRYRAERQVQNVEHAAFVLHTESNDSDGFVDCFLQAEQSKRSTLQMGLWRNSKRSRNLKQPRKQPGTRVRTRPSAASYDGRARRSQCYADVLPAAALEAWPTERPAPKNEAGVKQQSRNQQSTLLAVFSVSVSSSGGIECIPRATLRSSRPLVLPSSGPSVLRSRRTFVARSETGGGGGVFVGD